MKSYVRIAAPPEQIARAERNDHESNRDHACMLVMSLLVLT
jgi:hypothetical protein